MGKIVDTCRALRQELEAQTGITTRLAPAGVSLDFSKPASLPCLVLEGPSIQARGRDYRIDEEETDESPNEYGTKIYGLQRHRSRINLVFRARLFADRQVTQLDNVEKEIEEAPDIGSLTVTHDSVDYTYDVEIGEGWTGDLTPNMSDMKHSETEIVVGELEIRKDEYDEEVYELRNYDFELEEIA